MPIAKLNCGIQILIFVTRTRSNILANYFRISLDLKLKKKKTDPVKYFLNGNQLSLKLQIAKHEFQRR